MVLSMFNEIVVLVGIFPENMIIKSGVVKWLIKYGLNPAIQSKSTNLMLTRICNMKDVRKLWSYVKGYEFKMKRKWDRIESWHRLDPSSVFVSKQIL